MKREDINYFRDVLSCRLEDLLVQGNNTVTHLLEFTVNSSDPVDQASLEIDRNYKLRIRTRESKLISKIRQSLNRIEDGTFGVCEVCGREIYIERLKARPVTNCCIACKSKMEELENAIGA